jgi:hypothetical protein
MSNIDWAEYTRQHQEREDAYRATLTPAQRATTASTSARLPTAPPARGNHDHYSRRRRDSLVFPYLPDLTVLARDVPQLEDIEFIPCAGRLADRRVPFAAAQ